MRPGDGSKPHVARAAPKAGASNVPSAAATTCTPKSPGMPWPLLSSFTVICAFAGQPVPWTMSFVPPAPCALFSVIRALPALDARPTRDGAPTAAHESVPVAGAAHAVPIAAPSAHCPHMTRVAARHTTREMSRCPGHPCLAPGPVSLADIGLPPEVRAARGPLPARGMSLVTLLPRFGPCQRRVRADTAPAARRASALGV